MTFKKYVNIMSYNVAEYVVGWLFNGLQDGKNVEFILNHFGVVYGWIHTHPHPHTHIHTHTHPHTHTHIHTHFG